MHQKNIITAGKELSAGSRVLIMLHGRGGTAEDILTLSKHLHTQDFTLYAPQATNNTWYPFSFLSPLQENEPWLSFALKLLSDIVADLNSRKIESENIYFLGFSQGACLALEFTARNATKYGGIVAYSGGLIGDNIYRENYSGSFRNTPVFIGCSNPDFHIPVERVYASTNVMKEMGADVTEKIYDNMGHTINQDEIDQANKLVFQVR